MRFQEGNLVELLRKENDPCGCWFPGIVISVHENTYIVSYERLINQKVEPALESVNKEHVRPQPPQKKREIWMAGDIAEVFDVHCWRVAEIVQAMKNVHFVVRLIGSSHLRELHKSDLRIRQVWHNDGWSVVGKLQGNKETYLGQQRRSFFMRNLRFFTPVDDISCPRKNEDGDESIASCGSEERALKVDVHELELQAYKSTIKAMYASGPLSWEQEFLLTDLRSCLHISDNEHLLQLRHVLYFQAP